MKKPFESEENLKAREKGGNGPGIRPTQER